MDITFKDVCAYREEGDCINTYCAFKRWADGKISKFELGQKVIDGNFKESDI